MKISLGKSYIYVIYAFYMGTPILSELKHQTSVETSEGGSLQLARENRNAHLRRQSFLIASGRPSLPTPPSPGAVLSVTLSVLDVSELKGILGCRRSFIVASVVHVFGAETKSNGITNLFLYRQLTRNNTVIYYLLINESSAYSLDCPTSTYSLNQPFLSTFCLVTFYLSSILHILFSSV